MRENLNYFRRTPGSDLRPNLADSVTALDIHHLRPVQYYNIYIYAHAARKLKRRLKITLRGRAKSRFCI